MPQLLVLNTGSSGLKFATYDASDRLQPIQRGGVEGLGGSARLRITGADGTTVHDGAIDATTPLDAIDALGGLLSASIAAVGHRIVHGGPDFDSHVLVDDAALARIEAQDPLAPLHNPPAVAVLKAVRDRLGCPQVACFDTVFYRGHPAVADRFAIPDDLYQAGVRRYGFHGLSYEYIAGRLPAERGQGRVVAAHLGSGASLCALLAGRSVASTMGFTALDGVPMGTRSGEIDAGVLLWLMRERGMDADRLEHFLYKECGLKGLSGISADIRDLQASGSPLARLAVDYFIYHVVRGVADMAAALQGIDALVFTGGIGEHNAAVRDAVLDRLSWLRFAHHVIPTDEEAVIARHTWASVGAAAPQ